jgi:hypothetical protein
MTPMVRTTMEAVARADLRWLKRRRATRYEWLMAGRMSRDERAAWTEQRKRWLLRDEALAHIRLGWYQAPTQEEQHHEL